MALLTIHGDEDEPEAMLGELTRLAHKQADMTTDATLKKRWKALERALGHAEENLEAYQKLAEPDA